jgi:glycine dehydrogenase subunit 2
MKDYNKLVFECSKPGRVAYHLPQLDIEALDYQNYFPDSMIRKSEARLPEISELEVLRHYTNISQKNFGLETDIYPLGSCTMKYNPKINEDMASLEGFMHIHPLQDESSVQGALKLMSELTTMLEEITGMDEITLQPAAGSQGELTGLMIMKAYLESKGLRHKNKVIIPDSAHGTNPASVSMVGFEVVEIKSNDQGTISLENLDAVLDDQVAGLMLTNPNTLGLFEKDIVAIAKKIHDLGGVLYYDGANMNANLGITRPGDMGFDIVHLNLHKTFSTPHGGGGPGSGPVGVKKHLIPFLPNPAIVNENEVYSFKNTHQESIGKVKTFYGNFGMLVRAYTYIKSLGYDGLKQASELAVLNANYMKEKLKEKYNLPYPTICKHEFVLEGLKDFGEGASTLGVAKRLIDYGVHPPTIYFPLIVEQALMIEPTETESIESLDRYITMLLQIAEEAIHEPSLLMNAPVHASVKRLDEVNAARKPILKWEGLI